MNQRESFEQGHIETDAIYWDGEQYQPSNPGVYAKAVAETANNLYGEFKRGWQAAMDQLESEAVAYRRVSWESNEWVYTSDKPSEELAWQPLYDCQFKPLND